MVAKRKSLLVLILIIVFLVGCTPKQQAPPITAPNPHPAPPPATVSPPVNTNVNPPAPPPAKSGISDEVKSLLDKSKTRVSNIYYKYKGPETGDNYFDFYVSGDKIKYLPARKLQALDRQDSYNSIYINKAAKTAAEYCDDRACIYKGNKGTLKYDDAYIKTIFDWGMVSSAEKIGEEVIDDRTTWKVTTNVGTVWLDTFYGIPLEVLSNGVQYRFQQLNVNGVTDSDVTPSS